MAQLSAHTTPSVTTLLFGPLTLQTLFMLKGLEAHRFTKPAPIEIRPVAGVDDAKAEATITELPDDAEVTPKEGPAPPETSTEAAPAVEPTPPAAEKKDPPGSNLEAETKQMICLSAPPPWCVR